VVAPPVVTRPANAENGAKIYRNACVACHGPTGEGGEGGGASLVKGQSHDTILTVASTGRNNMPAFSSVYSPDELNDVSTYIVDVLSSHK
jgi:cytochrome c oxidase cbb3-type subunit 3